MSKRARSAKTGEFVTPKFAKSNKATTVVEKVKQRSGRAVARTVQLAPGDVRITVTNDDSLSSGTPRLIRLVPLPASGKAGKSIELEPEESATIAVGATRWFTEAVDG